MATKPIHIDAQGRAWNKYTCSFESPDGKFSFSIWGISFDHALLQLESLKETGRVDGEIYEEIPTDGGE